MHVGMNIRTQNRIEVVNQVFNMGPFAPMK